MTVVHSLYVPVLLLFLEPMCLNLYLFSRFAWHLVLVLGCVRRCVWDVYHFELWQVGVAFLGLLIGMLLAIASDPIWSWNYIRLVRRKESQNLSLGFHL